MISNSDCCVVYYNAALNYKVIRHGRLLKVLSKNSLCDGKLYIMQTSGEVH